MSNALASGGAGALVMTMQDNPHGAAWLIAVVLAIGWAGGCFRPPGK